MTRLNKDFFKEEENRLKIKQEVTKMLNDIKSLKFSKLQVDYDGYVLFRIDLEEKSNTMGELGYTTTVIKKYNENEEISSFVECIKEDTIQTMNIEASLWDKAKQVFKEKFKDAKNKPTKRAKAIEFSIIYRDVLNHSY